MTMSTSLVKALILSLVLKKVKGQQAVADCWNSTTSIFADLIARAPTEAYTYILCPNTVYQIGYPVNGVCCEGGEEPLVARTNIHYKCGEEGLSSNNCTVNGGFTQVQISDVVFEESSFNSRFEGFTFQGAEMSTSLPANVAETTFIDCIFKDQQNTGAIIAIHMSARRRRQLIAKRGLVGADYRRKLGYLMSTDYVDDYLELRKEADEERQRRALTSPGSRELQARTLNVLIFENCLFYNCSQRPSDGAFNYFGVVTADTPDNVLYFNSSIFEANEFGTPSVARTGYAVASLGSDVVMRNNCLLDNNFIGYGAVQIFQNASYILENNYGFPNDGGLQCQFVAFSPIQPGDASDITCIDYDATECAIRPTEPSSGSVPSAAPIPAPTSPVPFTVTEETLAPANTQASVPTNPTSSVSSRCLALSVPLIVTFMAAFFA